MDKEKQAEKFETVKRKTDNEGLRKSIEEKQKAIRDNKDIKK